MNPQYPVYIISKGRWNTRYTSKALEKMGVPYHIVVEPQEFNQYASVINQDKILCLPFSNLGQGSIPARNWVWEHSIATGAKRHWILDDNIFGFCRWNHHAKVRVASGTIFRCMEDFADRYENVAIAGPQYVMFVKARFNIPAFLWNRRIYSCILIKNDIADVNGVPFRWRGRYNEDTDLCLRVLKDGLSVTDSRAARWCTVLFHAFLADKATSMTLKGGNTDVLYAKRDADAADDSRLIMARSLKEQHQEKFIKNGVEVPLVDIFYKFSHWQHLVDYSWFKKNPRRLCPDFVKTRGVNNYGMKLVTVPIEDEEPMVEDLPPAPPLDMAALRKKFIEETRAKRG